MQTNAFCVMLLGPKTPLQIPVLESVRGTQKKGESSLFRSRSCKV